MEITSENWLLSARRTLNSLVDQSQVVNLLEEAFSEIAQEWVKMNIADGMPFSSGICPDGSPVEFSVKVDENSLVQVRFIAQPYNPDLDKINNLEFIRERSLNFVYKWSGLVGKQFIEQALKIYPDSSGPVPEGNFIIWLGLAVHTDSHRYLSKIYLNPWSSLPSYRGSYCIYHLLNLAGISSNAIKWIESLILQAKMPVTIIGVNIDKDSIKSIKVYFAATRTSLVTLSNVIEKYSSDLNSNKLHNLLDLAKQYSNCGEAHFALVFKPGQDLPTIKIGLLCPDWFPTDQVVLKSFMQLTGENSIEYRMMSLCDDWIHQRRFNVIGTGAGGADLYFKVARL